jgi:hypothetical protein
MGMDYVTIGIAGFTNLAVLACVVIYRWIVYWLETDKKTKNIKRNCTFFLLLLTPMLDLPMYASFFLVQEYVLFTFGFHKLQSAAIFGAYSMTISDWNSVLFEIRDVESVYTNMRFTCLCRNNCSLIAINIILSIISIVNFAYCYSFPDLNTYANSKAYMLGVFIQIVAPLVLTLSMLWAGLKLSWRIQGASGSLRHAITENSKLKELRSAVMHINIVMASVCVAIIIQVGLNRVVACLAEL